MESKAQLCPCLCHCPARALADFNDAVDRLVLRALARCCGFGEVFGREMGLMLERFGIDPALISRSQMTQVDSK